MAMFDTCKMSVEQMLSPGFCEEEVQGELTVHLVVINMGRYFISWISALFHGRVLFIQYPPTSYIEALLPIKRRCITVIQYECFLYKLFPHMYNE